MALYLQYMMVKLNYEFKDIDELYLDEYEIESTIETEFKEERKPSC